MSNHFAITEPGVYDIPAAAYHADPCPQPSLSSSIAKLMLGRSPRHAWTAHPRLNPDFEPVNKSTFDIGRAAHAWLLEGDDAFVVIDADDWRTKAAKEARDAAYAAGRTPLLRAQLDAVLAMAREARAQLAMHQDARDAFTDGKPEQSLFWREAGIWCRARLDWMPNSGRIFDDYKSTGDSAHPDDWGARQAFNLGFDVQAAFYRRGIRAVLGVVDPRFRFVVQENKPPFALSVIELTGATLDMADRKVDAALDLWRWCRQHDRWPGYPARTCLIEPLPWQEAKWLEREAREQDQKSAGQDFKDALLNWQAPDNWKGAA